MSHDPRLQAEAKARGFTPASSRGQGEGLHPGFKLRPRREGYTPASSRGKGDTGVRHNNMSLWGSAPQKRKQERETIYPPLRGYGLPLSGPPRRVTVGARKVDVGSSSKSKLNNEDDDDAGMWDLCEPEDFEMAPPPSSGLPHADAASISASKRNDEASKERSWVQGAASTMWQRTSKMLLMVLATAGVGIVSPTGAACGAAQAASAAGLLSPTSAGFVCNLCEEVASSSVYCVTCRKSVCPTCDAVSHNVMHQHSRTVHMLDGIRFALDAEDFLVKVGSTW